MNKIWTNIEKQYIRDNAGKKKDRELAEELSSITKRNISLQAVRKQRQKMGISKAHGRGVCEIVEKQEYHDVGVAVARKNV